MAQTGPHTSQLVVGRTVIFRCFEVMGVLFPLPEVPAERQGRAADGVRGGQSGTVAEETSGCRNTGLRC